MDFLFIMAGGSGERFWPLSRKSNPKQLLKLFSDNTLLGDTLNRLEGTFPLEHIYILTNRDQVEATRQALPAFPADHIISEPAKRDTGPAAALATAIARQEDPDAVIALLPADQLVKDTGAFRNQLQDGIERARQSDALLTIAIPPTYPATGFGYLHIGQELTRGSRGSAVHQVTRFVEKPDLDTARHYLEDGHYSWNAGIFIWRTSAFLEVARSRQPALAEFIETYPEANARNYLETHFPRLPKISLDYAIMEQAPEVEAVLAQFDWDDVGSWPALSSHLPADKNDNTIRGNVFTEDAHGNIFYARKRVIAACGVNDLIVVETEDAVLVCHKAKSQDLKKLLSQMPSEYL
jgi:mannose-1-phosphate guanylyltransferase